MMKKITLLVSSFICSNLLVNEGRCSGMMNKNFLELLHQKSRIIQRSATAINWKDGKIFIQDKTETRADDKLLDKQDLDELKRKSFSPPHRKAVKIDADEDIIYYEEKEK